MLPKLLKKFFWPISAVIILLILFLPGYTKLQELRDKNRDLETKIRKLYIENYILQEEVKAVQNDPTYQERLTRQKLGVVRKGEIPIKIIDGSKKYSGRHPEKRSDEGSLKKNKQKK